MKTKSVEETCMNYALSAFKGALNTYAHYRKQGYDKNFAMEKAMNLMWSMIESSGVLNDPKLRELFLEAVSAIEGMCRGVLEVIREHYKNSSS